MRWLRKAGWRRSGSAVTDKMAHILPEASSKLFTLPYDFVSGRWVITVPPFYCSKKSKYSGQWLDARVRWFAPAIKW